MVWIHGGGFYGGMGNLYEPDYLMEYDIIFVSFNYRLYIFGKECSESLWWIRMSVLTNYSLRLINDLLTSLLRVLTTSSWNRFFYCW